MKNNGFCPVGTITVALSTTTARSAALTSKLVRIATSNDCFVEFGGGSVNATTSSMPLKAAYPEVFDLTYLGHTNIAGILSASTGTLYITALR